MAGDHEGSTRGGSPGTPASLGSYRILHPLGSGGMSSVYRAVHETSGHEVALKVLPRSLARNGTMLQRFLREAKCAESLQHPNIIEIFDRGCEDGRYYLVLEFVPGGDLHERVRKDGPLPASQALDIIRQVCRGLRYAATQGLIHRDIKPANLLLSPDGKVHIADLGLALQPDEDDERVTRDGTTVGTVDYMAPEQARDSRATTVRSDIYSLGCTLYYLLAGQPPFARGDVPERLRKHAYDSPPDVRRLRPNLPPELARLIERMLAKKPDQRYRDYDDLLENLDALPAMPEETAPIALVDEPIESASTLADSPIDRAGLSGGLDRPPAIDTHEWPGARLPDTGDPSLRNLLRESKPEGRSPRSSVLGRAELIDLKPLPEEQEASPQRRPASSVVGPSAAAPPRPSTPEIAVPEPPPDEAIEALEEQQPEAAPEPQLTGFVRIKRPESPDPISTARLSKWVLTSAAVGVFLLLGWNGIQFLLYHSQKQAGGEPEEEARKIDQAPAGVRATEGGLYWLPPEAEAVAANADGTSGRGTLTGKTSVPSWSEPRTAPPAPAEAVPLDPAAVSALGLDSVVAAPPVRWPGPVTDVRRAVSDRGRGALDSIRRALDQLAGTVELSDEGPFFEQDFHLNGTTRAIRAAEGYRPIVGLEPPRLPSVRALPAAFPLEHKSLILQGIDLVIRANDLPDNQSAVFLCAAGDLTLIDCTVTIDGQRGSPLAVVQLGRSGTSPATGGKLRLERTLIRSMAGPAIALADGSATVEMVDSLILNGASPVVSIAGDGSPQRTIQLVRSLIATEGPLVELVGAVAATGAAPPQFRLLDCTIERLGPARESTGLVVDRDVPGTARSEGTGVDWKGSGNGFLGWASRQGTAPDSASSIRASDSASLGGGEQSPRDLERPEPDPSIQVWSEPDQLLHGLGTIEARHSRVARPRPNLADWSVQSFALLPQAPALADRAGTQDLAFNADDERLNGDLGRYLAETMRPGTRSVHVRVRGNGRKWVTPIALRPGVSLSITAEPTAAGGEPLLFVPRDTAECEALFLVRDASLRLENVQLERDARNVIKYLIQVDHGRLRLDRCHLRSAMQVEPGGGNLVSFRTDGTRPLLNTEEGAADSRPEWVSTRSLFMTGGRVVDASVGRGLIRFDQCTLAAGSAVFRLDAQAVAPDRFEADLQLDRCTIVAERDVIRFGSLGSVVRRPRRPWVVSTHGCALFDGFDRGPSPSTTVLLRSRPDALADGGLLWQSDHDAYAVTQFVTTGDTDQLPTSFPDLARDWVGFWGPAHVQAPIEAKGNIRLARERLQPGNVLPKDLVVRAINPSADSPPIGADAAIIESELPITKPTLPPSGPGPR